MIRQSFLQVGLNELNAAQRCAQNCDALLNERQMRSPLNSSCRICFLGDSLKFVARTWANANCVPHLSFFTR